MRRNQLYAVLGIATCLSVCSSGYAIHKAEPDPKAKSDPKVESDPKYKELFVYTCAALIKFLPDEMPTEDWRPKIRDYIDNQFGDAKFEKAILSKKELDDVLYNNDTYSDELFLQEFATLLKKTAEEIDPDLLSKAIPTDFNEKVRKATKVIFNEVKQGTFKPKKWWRYIPLALWVDESYISSVYDIFSTLEDENVDKDPAYTLEDASETNK